MRREEKAARPAHTHRGRQRTYRETDMHGHTEAHNLHMQTCTLADSEAESKASVKEGKKS